MNSAIIATLTAFVALSTGSAAAWALARLRVVGPNSILLGVLATHMFPEIVIAIPDWIGTYPALVLTHLPFPRPLVIRILKGFFEAIPPQLERAAAVDGKVASRVGGIARLAPDDVINVTLDPAGMIFFDRETGRRIEVGGPAHGRETQRPASPPF